MSYHKSVLLEETVNALNVIEGELYVDCNLGGGGHASEILSRGGRVIGFDVDRNALDYCVSRFKKELESGTLRMVRDNFRNFERVMDSFEIRKGLVSGVVYDLGLSTFQIKEEKKGFSFYDESELDMRMNDDDGVKAIDLILLRSEKDLANLIFEFGEESQAKIYANVIKDLANKKGRNLTAKELAEAIKNNSKYRDSKVGQKIHPATRVFQALRIAVNSELTNINESYGQAISFLKPGGRLVIISFHSLEDKVAKSLKNLPGLKKISDKPVKPSDDEIVENPSSRSARLRVYEKK